MALSDNLLVEKAKLLHKAMEESNIVGLKACKYSNGWLDGFKKRHNISLESWMG